MAKEASATTTPQLEANSLSHSHKHMREHEQPEEVVLMPAQRETFCQRAEEEDGNEKLVLTRDEFQDMLRSPETLYKEIIELITKTGELRDHRNNYCE
jgi:hypothetical protein